MKKTDQNHSLPIGNMQYYSIRCTVPVICRNRPVNFCEEPPTRFAAEEMPSPKGCCSKPATGMANALATMEKPANNRTGIMDAGGWHRQLTPRLCGRHVCYKLMSVNMDGDHKEHKRKKKKAKNPYQGTPVPLTTSPVL